MQKMLNKEKSTGHKRDPSNDASDGPKIQAREGSVPKRIKIYKKKDFENQGTMNHYDSKYEITGP